MNLELCNPKTLKEILGRHGFKPKKKYAQHFLCSPSVVQTIIEKVQTAEGILEVGPGPGILTAPLNSLGKKVIAVEIDPIAVATLRETAPGVKVILGDALEVDLDKLFLELPKPRALLSNMPYHITGLLLTRFAQYKDYFDQAVLMMQKEVGDRILAQPGNRQRGSLSVFLQSQFEIKKVISVKGSAFYPPPKVESIVLAFTPLHDQVPSRYSKLFYELIRMGFSHPRKTLINNLLPKYGREHLIKIMSELSLRESIRPHELEMQDWLNLAQKLHESR